jgi:betaine-homocysteine S-methyltransferase
MAADRPAAGPGLLERLEQGPVICAEGYLFEFERRGYLQAGAFVPEVVLEHPELVAQLHREFVHAGSDVVEAFTYYGHREKLRIIGKEELLEPLNRQALMLAKEVADETGTLFAGDICNTNIFEPDDDDSIRAVRMMFEEQVGWAAEAGADFVIAETISHVGEALLALETIKATGLPAVVTMAVHRDPVTRDGWTIAEACKRLEDAGADVVGVNCIRGPNTMLSLLGPIRDAVDGYVAALPVPYRTHEEEPTFQALRDPGAHDLPDGRPFPTALEPLACNRYEVAEFGRAAFELGVRYLGVCCGNAPHYTRSLAEALGRTPPASRYSPDMSKHAYYGSDERLKESNREFAREL